jgi:hypothetical protein
MSHEAFERAASPLALDMRNAVALLWRLMLSGIDTRTRWIPYLDIARSLMDRPEDLPFHHLHLAMALGAGGDWPAVERHLEVLRRKIPPDGTGLMAEVVLPLSEGMHAFAAGDWKRTIATIEPLRARIVEVGGSRTQRDVFHDTLLEACFRAGDAERAQRLLAERIARRPDHYWLNRALVA